ncbi:MAG: hypothetical protein L0H19_03220 [Salinisphaera sp.]|nr:hypothetical protein [Salinisphaera sp.]
MNPRKPVDGNGPEPLDPDAFGLAATAFDRARLRFGHGMREQSYRIAGVTVRLRILGPRLAAVLEQPWDHLRIDRDAAEPTLAIDVWHEAETGVAQAGFEPDPQLGLYGYLSASQDARYVAELRPHSAQWMDRLTRRTIVWVSSLDRLSLGERARPFHQLLALQLANFGIQPIHAGLVGWQGRGALFVGKGGSGKSTCSICCALDGAGYCGDDYVGLAAEHDGSYSGHSLYGTALISPAHQALYPSIASACLPPNHAEEIKSMLWLGDLACAKLQREVAIRAVVLPQVNAGAAQTRYERVSPRDALLALAPSSLYQQQGAGPGSLERLGALVEQLPAYRLDLGQDVRQIPDRVKEILAGAC